MCSFEEFSFFIEVVDDDLCFFGFVCLKRSSDNVNIDEFFDVDGNFVLYLVRLKFEEIVRLVMFDFSLWSCCRICLNFVFFSFDIGIVCLKLLIIIEFCWNGLVYKNMLYLVDFVLVIDVGVFWFRGVIL